jgi:hypothetical protein
MAMLSQHITFLVETRLTFLRPNAYRFMQHFNHRKSVNFSETDSLQGPCFQMYGADMLRT